MWTYTILHTWSLPRCRVWTLCPLIKVLPKAQAATLPHSRDIRVKSACISLWNLQASVTQRACKVRKLPYDYRPSFSVQWPSTILFHLRLEGDGGRRARYEGPSAWTCAVTQVNHMERSAGDANAIIEEMSEKKTACMWEECMPDNHQSACRTFSPSPPQSSVERRRRRGL